MNPFSEVADQPIWHIAGWTMLHYLWLGALVSIFAIALRLLLRRAAANVRYAAALVCLCILTALPIAIATWLATSTDPPLASAARPNPVPTSDSHIIELSDPATNPPRATFTEPSPLLPIAISSAPSTAAADTAAPPSTANTSTAADLLTLASIAARSAVLYLPWLWIIGTPITFALLAAGVVGTKRLRSASHSIDDPRISSIMQRLSSSLRITRRVTLAVCDRIASPVLLGIVRPMILLPPAALTGWSPDEIEMVLLHELAHVRRWDNLVNLIQRLIESLLFFHPAVWLVSNWVRREREQCCDAFVVRRTDRPHAYAELLVALASQMPRSVLFHSAASSAISAGPLRSRIRRILQLEDDPMLISGKSLALTLASLLVAATLAVLYLPTLGQADEANSKQSTTEATESTDTNNPLRTESSDPGHAESSVAATISRLEDARKRKIPLIVVFFNAKGELYQHVQERYEQLTERGQPIYLYGIQVDPASKAAKRYGLIGVPTLVVFRDGKERARFENVRSVDQLKGYLDAALAIQNDKFPTLEEQKLADLVWKRLGLEMEPIGEEDLQRVKAFGYDGGLKVTAGSAGGVGGGGAAQILTGDILVGLHVWPTVTMKDVTAVLNRDDLGELNPLKFYAIRKDYLGDGTDRPPTLQDRLVTGRVSVQQATPVEKPGYSEFGVLTPSRKPLADNPPLGAIAPLPGAPQSQTELRPVKRKAVMYFFYSPTSQPATEMRPIVEKVALNFAGLSLVLVDVSADPDQAKKWGVDAVPTFIIHRDDKTAFKHTGTLSIEELQEKIALSLRWTPPQSPYQGFPSPPLIPSATKRSPTDDKSALRYDGKSFDEWRDLWQNELSAAKRAEAVRALAAFARAGYGKEATGLILDVAGNYDFLVISQDAEGKLKEAVLDELAPQSRSSDLTKYWLPDLVERLKKDPEKWQYLVSSLLYRLPTKDPNVLATVQSLAESGPPRIRFDALLVLVRKTVSQSPDGTFSLDEKARQLLADGLRDDDPARLRAALPLLLQYSGSSSFGGGGRGGGDRVPPPVLLYQPELMPLLFHKDEAIRQLARYVLQYISDKDAPQVVEQLVAVLKDDSRKQDHLDAIRALAAMGKHAQAAAPELARLLAQTDDKEILVATIVAITRMTGEPAIGSGTGDNVEFNADAWAKAVNQFVSEDQQATLNAKYREKENALTDRLLSEDKSIFPPKNPQQLGGGGGVF